MNFTFGIITKGNEEYNLSLIFDSIEKQKIHKYEIIVVGDCKIETKNLKKINFNENNKSNWITKKKNLITEHSSYENIVYLHDYIIFEDGWYEGFIKFGNNWNLCMNVIKNSDGSRYRDWCLWLDDALNLLPNHIQKRCLIPYNMKHLSKAMYFSGSYFISKRVVMNKYKFNEKLCWGQGEDVEWSIRVRNEYNFDINEHSSVKLLKYKTPPELIFDDEILILNNVVDYDQNQNTYLKLINNHIKKYI